MPILDIGSAAIDRATSQSTITWIDLANPLNASGTITSVELWFVNNATGVKVGVATDDGGGSYTCSNAATVGSVTSGSKQTFTVSIVGTTGQYIAVYFATGNIEMDSSGGSGGRWKAGDQFGAGSQAFTLAAGYAMSAYGTGAPSSFFLLF